MPRDAEKIALIAMVMQMCYLYLKIHKNKNRNRKWWIRPLYQNRHNRGYFQTTFKQIKENDEDLLFNATRLTRLQYDLLLSLIKSKLTKTSIRRPISPECRMVVTLMYLSQGASFKFLAESFRMGLSTVRSIIIEVCDVLWKVLSPAYMPEMNANDWKFMSTQINDRCHIPHCVGIIDGKHIEIKRPPKSGTKYINYKGFYSTVLLAVCNANYTFTVVDVGTYGSQQNQGKDFTDSTFGKMIFSNNLQLPPPEKLPNSDKVVPYFFVGDDAFPLRMNLLRPYLGNTLDAAELIFNDRLSEAREITENTFGILVARWRILNKCIEFQPKNANKVILACTVLHNFIKTTDSLYNSNYYCPEGFCDMYNYDGTRIDGIWRQEIQDLISVRRCGNHNREEGAFEVRRKLAQYLLNEGQQMSLGHSMVMAGGLVEILYE
ncbi:uncharacterized protein LOC129911851 [Episyrphus balteatus]|uniref:uncharacterized protein LOC129911851 n=1 Tax=Episyrphus balteatus TaxID=286459 RepID=UPI0024851C29|nr:uncharacterized protein LOC129911851 [Episyrphus balteatus]